MALSLQRAGIDIIKSPSLNKDLISFLKKQEPSQNEMNFYGLLLDLAVKDETFMKKMDLLTSDNEVSNKVK